MNSIEYIDAVKKRYGWDSDYKVSKELGISRQAMSKYRNGKITIGDEICLKVAKLLEVNPASVLIDITAERTKSKAASKILHDTAKELIGAVASICTVIIVLGGSMYPTATIANNISILGNTVYYVK